MDKLLELLNKEKKQTLVNQPNISINEDGCYNVFLNVTSDVEIKVNISKGKDVTIYEYINYCNNVKVNYDLNIEENSKLTIISLYSSKNCKPVINAKTNLCENAYCSSMKLFLFGSEIEYTSTSYDSERFLLYMNDGNQVYITLNKIKEFIPDFNYEDLLENTYTIDHIKELYNSESNAYLKIQLFRALKDIVDDKQLSLRPMDSAWYKFIDETYHIENDYLHYLDVMKFNIVPDYIMKKVDGIMSEL